MSATNRGAVRATNDFYQTPTWLTEAILRHLPKSPATILEPSCGSGAIVRVLEKYYPDSVIVASDIDARFSDPPVDFLTARPDAAFDLVITNPPYALAREFIEASMKWRRNESSVVAMLLRLNFLGGQGRAPWIRSLMPAIFVTPRRPSFTGGSSSDATEYCWALFGDQVAHGTYQILETEPKPPSLGLFGAGR